MTEGENFEYSSDFRDGIAPGEEFRQHPIKIAEEVLTAAVIAFFMFFTLYATTSEGDSIMGDYSALISAGLYATVVFSILWVSYWRWRKTTIIFKETEVRVFRDTVFKREVRIAYTKIASTNVNRGIINRLTGTSKLMININSSVNAMMPELKLTFDAYLTDRIRRDLAMKMHIEEFIATDPETPSVLNITVKDVIVHSLLSQPTASSAFGLAMFLIAVLEMFVFPDAYVVGPIALLMFTMSYAIPVIMMIAHYYNYKIYKSGDTIHISHGLIRTYNKSFKTTRINAVRLRSPLIPRLFGRYMIDAEVVGLVTGDGGENQNTPPLLCPMKDKATIDNMMEILVPDFVSVDESILQPKEAKVPIFARIAVHSAIVATAFYLVYEKVHLVYVNSGTDPGNLPFWFVGIAALIVISMIVYGIRYLKVISFKKGEEVFTFVTGVVDRKEVTVKYDKVQIATVSEGPLSKPFGLARGDVNLLSSVGSQSIRSGFFRSGDMKGISEEVLARINDSRYDYRKYL